MFTEARGQPYVIAAQTRSSRLVAMVDSTASVMGDTLVVGGTSFDSLCVNVNGESRSFDRYVVLGGRASVVVLRPCARELRTARAAFVSAASSSAESRVFPAVFGCC